MRVRILGAVVALTVVLQLTGCCCWRERWCVCNRYRRRRHTAWGEYRRDESSSDGDWRAMIEKPAGHRNLRCGEARASRRSPGESEPVFVA